MFHLDQSREQQRKHFDVILPKSDEINARNWFKFFISFKLWNKRQECLKRKRITKIRKSKKCRTTLKEFSKKCSLMSANNQRPIKFWSVPDPDGKTNFWLREQWSNFECSSIVPLIGWLVLHRPKLVVGQRSQLAEQLFCLKLLMNKASSKSIGTDWTKKRTKFQIKFKRRSLAKDQNGWTRWEIAILHFYSSSECFLSALVDWSFFTLYLCFDKLFFIFESHQKSKLWPQNLDFALLFYLF